MCSLMSFRINICTFIFIQMDEAKWQASGDFTSSFNQDSAPYGQGFPGLEFPHRISDDGSSGGTAVGGEGHGGARTPSL